MDEIIEAAKQIREDIDSLPIVQEYYRLKDLYENDKELEELRRESARLTNEGKEEEKKNLLHIYENHPLVNNYNIAKEQVQELLLSIKEIID